MKNAFNLLLVSCCVLVLSSCEYTDIILPDGSDIVVSENLSFSTDIEPIFKAQNCTNCHPGLSQPDLSAGKAYNSIVNNNLLNTGKAGESLIYTVPSPDEMHSAKYTLEQAAMVLAWIEQGAENN